MLIEGIMEKQIRQKILWADHLKAKIEAEKFITNIFQSCRIGAVNSLAREIEIIEKLVDQLEPTMFRSMSDYTYSITLVEIFSCLERSCALAGLKVDKIRNERFFVETDNTKA